jgi:hypothetical protein
MGQASVRTQLAARVMVLLTIVSIILGGGAGIRPL